MMGMFLNTAVELNNILIYGWNTRTWKDMLIAAVIICVLTIVFEGLKVLKLYVIVKRKYNLLTNEEEGYSNGNESSSQANLLSSHRIPVSAVEVKRRKLLLFTTESLLHMFNFLYAYILMLLVMSYSVWFLLAVIVGSGIGFFISHPLEQYFALKYSPPKIQSTEISFGGVPTHRNPSYNLQEHIICS